MAASPYTNNGSNLSVVDASPNPRHLVPEVFREEDAAQGVQADSSEGQWIQQTEMTKSLPLIKTKTMEYDRDKN